MAASLNMLNLHEVVDGGSHDGDSGVFLRIETTTPRHTSDGQENYDVQRKVSTAIPQIHRQGMAPSPIRTYTSWGRQSRIAFDRSKIRNRNIVPPVQIGTDYNVTSKGISLTKAIESRPPLRKDMIGPTATTYSPCNKPLYETNAPSYSFGRKESNKKGSGQKSWSKLWFRSHSPHTFKTNYETAWPSPFHYEMKTSISNAGPTIGVRRTVAKSPTIIMDDEGEPPLLYPKPVLKKAPSYTMGIRIPQNYWTPSLKVPAANAYNPLKPALVFTKRSIPAYTVRGIRGTKRHQLGPFASL